ncbi:MAG: YggS family pyridoxal phosphate-dependent enzyme [Chloroflexi bacterium]|nr:YggS family pyridoxal phosphate-dependent enzyme [Chloroflexota bacterium]
MVSATVDIAHNLARVREAIDSAAVRAGREPSEITLVAVSKTQPAAAIVAAVAAGARHLGENRVQEAATKVPHVREALGGQQPPTWHMIGHLQTNKAGAAVELFERIDSVDSLKLAQALSRRATADVPVLVEVYVGSDPERPGVRPDQLEDVVGAILEVPRIRIEGLMTIAPLGEPPRPAFNSVREMGIRLARVYPRVHFGVLSMGMSEDFPIAIEEGSTEVRIGTALFGPRQPN